ncbi:YqjF family protein [Sphingobacterium siyangense]|uniref:YqjF family protein n=1 Tax=Sphingobacterium siyangense TaxID=459529 RepID=UPI0019662273|nr:DUF2071 domain-containing protein [Sphingobacterium siyangense]QRY55485.1 DUF2071 domain-containing protein [Sphingobacterium siyangense]
MEKIESILNSVSHRQYPLPLRPWKQYQEWHGNIFMHWKSDAASLASLLPKGLELDLIHSEAWISIVAFSVKKLHPRFLPPLPFLSDFHEVNVRTYVRRNGIPGIYFLSIEAQKLLPVLLARLLIGLPYMKSEISRKQRAYHSHNKEKMLKLDFAYLPHETITEKTELDIWLTERHALYLSKSGRLHRIDVHHKEWPLQYVELYPKVVRYPLVGSGNYEDLPDKMHYAQEVTALLWGSREC